MSSINNEIDIAKAYFDAIHSRDYEAALALTSPDMQFSDPTAAYQEGVIVGASRDEFFDYMKAGSEGLEAETTVTHAFKTGKYVTLHVSYKGKMPGDALGSPGKTLSFDSEGVTILTVEQGKVVHQLDYVDYETINKQFGLG